MKTFLFGVCWTGIMVKSTGHKMIFLWVRMKRFGTSLPVRPPDGGLSFQAAVQRSGEGFEECSLEGEWLVDVLS